MSGVSYFLTLSQLPTPLVQQKCTPTPKKTPYSDSTPTPRFAHLLIGLHLHAGIFVFRESKETQTPGKYGYYKKKILKLLYIIHIRSITLLLDAGNKIFVLFFHFLTQFI